MTTYLSRLTDHPSFQRLSPFIPPDICPFLFYNLAPYIFTLAHGGWFGWVNKHRIPQKRGPVGQNDFTKKGINRKYINEVLVSCPNPGKKVVAGIGPWEKKQVAIRILQGHGDCPNGHQAGQTALLDRDTCRTDAQQFHRLFPEVVLASLGDTSLTEAIQLYDQHYNNNITVSEIIAPCRFHPHSKNATAPLPFANLLPDNFCPHVFAAIYPQVLALMYGASIAPVVTIEHPGDSAGTIRLQLQKTPQLAGRMLSRLASDLAEKGLQWIGHPIDRLNYDMSITVRVNDTPTCLLPPGSRYAVNINNPDFLCPAAFAALYPYLLLTAAGKPLPWHDTPQICCPDCAGCIYRLN